MFPTGWYRHPLAFILLAGFGLRAANLLWGTPLLPYSHSFHPDEINVYRMVSDFPEVYVTDDRFRPYGTAVSFAVGLLLLPLKAVMVYGLNGSDAYETVALIATR